MRIAVLLTLLILLCPLSGCFGGESLQSEQTDSAQYPSEFERHTLDWNWTDSYSYVLQPGPYTALEAVSYTHLTLPTKA